MVLQVARWRAWLAWGLHVPLGVYWFMAAVAVGSGVLALWCSAWTFGAVLLTLGTLATLAAVIEGMARQLGVPAWPWLYRTRRAADDTGADPGADPRDHPRTDIRRH